MICGEPFVLVSTAVHRDSQIEHLLNIGDFVLKIIMAEANYQK
jgi:hypothetical protein